MKKWFIKNKKTNHKEIAKAFDISEFTAKLLVNRDIIEHSSIKTFINPTYENFHNPREMKDIEKGVEIIKRKINQNKRIMIVGDYDVDGIVSVYQLYTALKRCGVDVIYEIPDRINDGYGINSSIIDRAHDLNVDTIMTCDNGISATKAISYGKELGMTIIVTDHHDIPFIEKDNEKKYIKPDADAIINPKQKDCGYKFKDLCGAGVVFKFIEVLYEEFGIDKNEAYEFMECVAIATVCDVVDLIDENRIFVKNGLNKLNKTSNIGLGELIKVSGLKDKEISSYHVGFVIGPCLNASGRLSSAKKGVELLCTDDIDTAKCLAQHLHDLNKKRQSMTQCALQKSMEYVEEYNLKDDKIFVIYILDLHESIAGIVAGRIKDYYNVPTIVLTKTKDGVKGSGRSIEGYNMFEELTKCKDILEHFGGHYMAAGLSLKEGNVKLLKKMLNSQTNLTDEDIIPKIYIDMQLPLENINFNLVNELNMLEPFGKGNSKPLFGEKNIKIIKASILGKNKNVLKLNICMRNGKYIEGICFGKIEDFEETIISKYSKEILEKIYFGQTNVHLDLIFYPNINKFNGNVNIQIIIEDLR